MIANGAKEKLNRAFDWTHNAWLAFCEANGQLVKAKAARDVAAEEYRRARRNLDETYRACTPGEMEEEGKVKK